MTEQSSTALIDRIQTARTIHAQLRSLPPTADLLDSKRSIYESLKSLFDDLLATIDQDADQHNTKLVQSAICSLILDAEWFAGIQGDAEGLRGANDVFSHYDLLESHFTSSATNNAMD